MKNYVISVISGYILPPNDNIKTFWLSSNADLQRRNLQGVLHQGGCMENNGLRDEGRLDGPRVEQVWMVAHFAELHEDVNDRHEVTTGQSFPGPVNQRQKVLNEETKMLI